MTPDHKEAVERVKGFCDRAELLGGMPEDDDYDADLGREAIKLRHDLRTLLSALEEAERERDEALTDGHDLIAELHAEADSAIGLLQEAVKVVEPFANEFGDDIPRPDSMKLYGNLRLGDFRRARAFLTRLNAKETDHD